VITARALGILEEIVMNPDHGGAKGLSEKVGEGKFAIQNAISELRSAGLVETITHRMANGRTVSILRPTEDGNQVLVTRFHTMQRQLNSYLYIDTYSINNKPNSESSSREEENVEYYDSEEERSEAKRKFRERQVAEKAEAHEKRTSERMQVRDSKTPVDWSTTDSTFEFANQMHELWHVQPWKVTRSRFRFALSDKRAEYGTDGEMEQKMMKIYFSALKHDTKMTDPEIIWKRFIVQFGNLLEEAKRQSVTLEDVEVVREKAKIRNRGLMDV